MNKLSLVDAGFLLMERAHQPMNIGGLYLFDRPKNAPDDWLGDLRNKVKAQSDDIGAPFNLKLAKRFGQYHWVEDDDVDVDYHLRHTALPAPGRYRELFELIGRLHSTRLDRDRPLWETQIIEGIEQNQWALYIKIHHALLDGMGGIRLIRKMFSDSPEGQHLDTPWTKPIVSPTREVDTATTKAVLAALAYNMQSNIGAIPGVVGALRKHFKILSRKDIARIAPYDAPKTVLNGRISVARRFVAQSYSIARIKRVAKAADATINDVMLAMCSSALRTWLINWAELPDRPLTVMVPVAMRDPKSKMGNAVTMICASLVTHVPDPINRLKGIQTSINAGKDMLSSLSPTELNLFTSISGTPTLLPSVLGIGNKTPPPFNLTISNVPGPRETLYCHGSELKGCFPTSIPLDGAAVNITAISYVDQLCFGITACRRSMPRAQNLIDYMEDGLTELEVALGLHTQ